MKATLIADNVQVIFKRRSPLSISYAFTSLEGDFFACITYGYKKDTIVQEVQWNPRCQPNRSQLRMIEAFQWSFNVHVRETLEEERGSQLLLSLSEQSQPRGARLALF